MKPTAPGRLAADAGVRRARIWRMTVAHEPAAA
jgi:hypothetical protein